MVDLTSAAHLGGTGRPLLLLHGLYMSWSIWQPVLGCVERHHTVFAPTLPGHRGGPPLDPRVDCMAAMADVLEHQLDDLGWDRADVAGNSLGGWLALELAARGRARSVVAFSPAGAWTNKADLRRLSRQLGMMRRVADSHTVSSLLARPRTRRLVLRPAMEHGDRVPLAVARGFLADTAACIAMDPLRTWAHRQRDSRSLAANGVPILIAWPTKDRLIPWARYGLPFRQISAGAEVVRLHGVGHVPMYDDPQLVAETILSQTAVRSASAPRCAPGP